ncbi:hypothetical protein D3C75_1355890 [compost metagenome]
MEWAICSSFAPITGAVAAIADPPQIAEPTPTSVIVFHSNFNSLPTSHAVSPAASKVNIINKMVCFPAAMT